MKRRPFVDTGDRSFDTAHVAKPRQCLRCQKIFASEWCGERICLICRRSSTWQSGIARRPAFAG